MSSLTPKERRERKRAYMVAWREAHREQIVEQRRTYRHQHESSTQHIERRREYMRAYRAANPDRFAALRARERETTEQRKRVARRTREYTSAAQAATASAGRRGVRWTPDEDAVATRNDLTAVEIALRLDRGYWAVVARRQRLLKRARTD